MMLQIPGILSAAEATDFRERLETAGWVDGRGTAGHLSAAVKHNAQLHWQDPLAIELGHRLVARLDCHPMFLSAALPREILPPLFNRYEGGGHYGPHIDGAIRPVDGTARRIRTDLSLTVFLSDPAEYDGGALEIMDFAGGRSIRFPAGDAILYPASTLHQVTPVTRGVRLAAFTWMQSLVRDDGERAMLFEIDTAIQRLPAGGEVAAARLLMTNVYHNLLRRWTDL